MKKIVVLFIMLFFISYAVAEEIDKALAKDAEVVLRVNCKNEADECEKYCWQEVNIIKVLKNESDYTFPNVIKVAYYNREKGIPIGISTIYLEKYNLSRNNLWKLVGGKAERGVSHYTEQSR